MFLLDVSAQVAEHTDLHVYERLRRTCKTIRRALTDNDHSALAAAKVTFPLGAGSKDAAVLITLAPGVYTAKLTGVGKVTGEGLLEVYEVWP